MKNCLYSVIGILLLICHNLQAQIPAADFKANITRVCVGNTIVFSDSTTNNPTSWSWTFQGGSPNSSMAQQPGVSYDNVGIYDVTLQATNSNGNDTETKNNYINVIMCRPSKGVYRIPYANGTEVFVGNDHLNHRPVNGRIDMNGMNGSDYVIVAAEDGVIKYIEDTKNDSQGICDNNNYVWIEHPNGEWTKYSHMEQFSTTAQPPNGFGRFVGQTVCAGTPLGIESDIGCAFGDHLHFEVGIPDDLSNPFDTVGGFLNGPNLVPVICDISTNKFFENATYIAANCSSNCINGISFGGFNFNPPSAIVIPVKDFILTPNFASTKFNAGSSGVFRAGEKITLKPGFHAKSGSSFWAAIRDCNSSPGLPACNIMFLQEGQEEKK